MPIELNCTSCGKPYFSRTNDGSSLCPVCRTAAFSADEPMPVPRASSTDDGSGSPETTSVKNSRFRLCLTCCTLTYFMFLGLGLVVRVWQHPDPGIFILGGIATLYGLVLFPLVQLAIAASTIDELPESPLFKKLRQLATTIDEAPEILSIQKKPRSRLWLAYFVILWLALIGAIGLFVANNYVSGLRMGFRSPLVYSDLVCIGTFAALLLFPIVMLALRTRKLRGRAILLLIAGMVGFGFLILFLGFLVLLIMSGPFH